MYLEQKISWNYLWAGLCLLGAVFFIFRDLREPHGEKIALKTPPAAKSSGDAPIAE